MGNGQAACLCLGLGPCRGGGGVCPGPHLLTRLRAPAGRGPLGHQDAAAGDGVLADGAGAHRTASAAAGQHPCLPQRPDPRPLQPPDAGLAPGPPPRSGEWAAGRSPAVCSLGSQPPPAGRPHPPLPGPPGLAQPLPRWGLEPPGLVGTPEHHPAPRRAPRPSSGPRGAPLAGLGVVKQLGVAPSPSPEPTPALQARPTSSPTSSPPVLQCRWRGGGSVASSPPLPTVPSHHSLLQPGLAGEPGCL